MALHLEDACGATAAPVYPETPPGPGPGTTTAVRAVTATMLADIVRCEMRAHLDIHGDPAERGAVSSFVEMLWGQGLRHEARIVDALPGRVVDLRAVPMDGRAAATVAAVGDHAADWIIGARLVHGDLEGRPDLLHRVDGAWAAGDVKSGGALADNGRDPRVEYAAQTGLYAHLMDLLRLGHGDRAFVVGRDGTLEWYDVGRPFGRDGRTVAGLVADLISHARSIRDGQELVRPALSSQCGLCVWRAACKASLAASGDLTLVAGLGRSVRKGLEAVAPTVASLADLDIDGNIPPGGRTGIPGVGAARLATFRERARVLVSSAPPFAIRPLGLARRDVEHHLDLETDPTAETDFCYLHGVWRRRRIGGEDVEDYVHFLAAEPSQERDAFAAAVNFLTADPAALITTFSAFERTTYRRLAARYPEVGAERVEALFDPVRCVDLYFDVILKSTHWPLSSLGLKSVARHLGFQWADADASGANSISWFVEWMETRDPALLERILSYNRDDCVASRVVFDGAMELPVTPVLPWPPAGTRL